jgi:hypothetical protein
MGSPTGGANQKKVKSQFLDQTKVYYYTDKQNIQTDQAEVYELLSFDDMAESNTSELPESHSDRSLKAAKCVIEVLAEWGIRAPGKTASVKDWHDYTRGKDLDYRQDNNYIVLYVQQLGYRLISSTWTKWTGWNPGDGRYIVSSSNNGPGPGVGHMIGVDIDGDDRTITDVQGLSPGTGSTPTSTDRFYVRYVFRVR